MYVNIIKNKYLVIFLLIVILNSGANKAASQFRKGGKKPETGISGTKEFLLFCL